MTTLGFDYTRTVDKSRKEITVPLAKKVFTKRFDMMKDINRKLEKYEFLRSRAFGTSASSNDTIAKLGCRVQTSINTERNVMLDTIILEEEIVEAQHELTTYDDMLRHIINEAGLTDTQKILMDIVYFTNESQPTSFSQAVPIFQRRAHINREFSRYYIQNELNRIFSNNIVPTLTRICNK